MSELNTQAPNMFAYYPDSGNYDLVMVDWLCETDATNTYWAVHQFSTNDVDGYAGFQNNEGNHFLIFSLWNHGTNYPIVEYVSALTRLNDLTFGNEGNGKRIITDYEWVNNTWYTMCIGTKTIAGITYYAQWISVQGTNDWLLCGIISYPETDKSIGSDLMFQEDFLSNNLRRQCLIKNAFGRYNGTSNWHTWNTYNLTNDFYKYTDSQVPIVVRYDCFYEVDNSQAIRIRSGGENLVNPVNNNIYPSEPLTINSPSSPAFHPNWSEPIPKYIKNKEGDLFVSIGANDTIVLSSTPYYWFFIDTNDEYYYILNADKSKALTIEGSYTGAAILLSTFAQLDTQKWYNESFEFSEYSNYIPKNAQTLEIDVNGNAQVGATLLLNTQSSTILKRRWLALNSCCIHKIKSYYSNKYVVPSTNKIIQQSNSYEWNFVNAGNDEFYILSRDNTKAITLSGTNDGDDLLYSAYTSGNTYQKWKIQSAGNNKYYIVPVANQNMNMSVEGPSMQEGTDIEIKTHSQTPTHFKWFIV